MKHCGNFFTQCWISVTIAGDGIDNDCDGKIDEEIQDKRDNDGDGFIDEDLSEVRTFFHDFVLSLNYDLALLVGWLVGLLVGWLVS